MRALPSICFLAAIMTTALSGSAAAQMIQTHCVTSNDDQATQRKFGPPPVGETWESMQTCKFDNGELARVRARSWPTYRRGLCISYEKDGSDKAPLIASVLRSQNGRCPAPSQVFYARLDGVSLDEFRSISDLDLQGAIRAKYPHAGKPVLWRIYRSSRRDALIPEYTVSYDPDPDLTFYEVRVWRLSFGFCVIRDVGKAII